MIRTLVPVLGLLLASPLAATEQPPSDECVYRGSERQLSVNMPRVENAEIEVDGQLSEPMWKQAALLTGFTQYEPVEGVPASERTQVLLFYTPSALYVGVRAYAADPSRVRATLADRDNIRQDDRVGIFLDTFHDQRRAFAFFVNPLGIQQDGLYSEGADRRNPVDLKSDFLYDSQGELTADGYTVELRIPFKSLKFPSTEVQTWGINIIRQIPATGAEETWAPLSRDNPSRLAQSGTLVGIADLRPGRLFQINPVATGKQVGSVEDGQFRHEDFEPSFGMNLKYGVTSNLTLDATYNPDFSQVEADAGQITTNERFAIHFPEKRPFFLEGADVFSTPEPLVYTRSIVDPIAGAKLTGKMGAFTVGYLGAVDESPLANPGYAPRPSRATFNIARVQRDVGAGSSLGLLITDREAADQYNRVAGVDGRIRFGGAYTWGFQAAQSWTRSWHRDVAGVDTARVGDNPIAVSPWDRSGHLLQISLDRTARNWGFYLQMKDIPDAFRAQSGFIRRTGVTDFFLANRLTFYGEPGALLESWSPFLMANRIFGGRDFWGGRAAEEGMARLRTNFNLRGNHRVTFGYSNQFYVLDSGDYAAYVVPGEDGTRTGDELIRPHREMRGLDGFSLEGRSSYFKTVSMGGEVEWQETPIFAEGTRGEAWSAEAEAELRPTDALRVDASLRHARIFRQADGSLYSRATLPRLKIEYQLSRAVFLRAVGQYSVEEVDLLRAPDGTPYLLEGGPFRVRRGEQPAGEPQLNPVLLNLLFSYQPSPGTVLFLGYGREMNDSGAYRFSPLEPQADGLFFKLSYLFRS